MATVGSRVVTPQLFFSTDILLFALEDPIGKHKDTPGMQNRMLDTYFGTHWSRKKAQDKQRGDQSC